ncbi:hypothetical protein [Sphingomonas sp.]|uniref:hypothetical protein n=1 Tax=Sphingomonas sp. TaxID=28214 RepID=UPI002DD644ED|nr:hypothetical protein [Sphingomonas sp.]
MVIRVASFGPVDPVVEAIVPAAGQHERGAPLDVAIISAIPRQEDHAFDALTDADFTRLCLDPLLELERSIADALSRLRRDGMVLLVTGDAWLGEPDAAPQSAACGAVMTLMRSIATRADLPRANLVAIPLHGARRTSSLAAEAAAVVRALIAAPSINGQALILDRGEHLVSRHVGRR